MFYYSNLICLDEMKVCFIKSFLPFFHFVGKQRNSSLSLHAILLSFSAHCDVWGAKSRSSLYFEGESRPGEDSITLNILAIDPFSLFSSVSTLISKKSVFPVKGQCPIKICFCIKTGNLFGKWPVILSLSPNICILLMQSVQTWLTIIFCSRNHLCSLLLLRVQLN